MATVQTFSPSDTDPIAPSHQGAWSHGRNWLSYNPQMQPFEELTGRLASLSKDFAGSSVNIVLTAPSSELGVSTIAQRFALTLVTGGEKTLLVQVLPGTERSSTRTISKPADLIALARKDGEEGYDQVIIDTAALPAMTPRNEAFYRELAASLKSVYTKIIWDVPPLPSSPVSAMLARVADGVILVAQAGRTRWQTMKYCQEQVRHAGGQVLGVILNRKKSYIPNWLYRLLFKERF
jgi:hypothetical protein